MSQLLKIQRAFQESLLKRDDSVADYFAKPNDMSETDRLQVYYNDYFFRLRDSLKEDYEKTCLLMGETKFESLLEVYVKAYPSSTYTLREIGYEFPIFLAEKKQDLSLIELAQFECEMIKALYAQDAPLVTMEALSAIDPDRWAELCFYLHPSVRQLNVDYNTLSLWSALNNNEHLASVCLETPSTVLIWRHQQSAYFRQLDKEETVLFSEIQSEKSFADLCEKMLDYFNEEDVVPWIAGILQTWVTDGLFVANRV